MMARNIWNLTSGEGTSEKGYMVWSTMKKDMWNGVYGKRQDEKGKWKEQSETEKYEKGKSENREYEQMKLEMLIWEMQTGQGTSEKEKIGIEDLKITIQDQLTPKR